MRIISGKLKSRRLVPFDEEHIRPTTDRVKETMFNLCDWNLEGTRVLDLFCGTGNLGIEAASRGAAQVVFVDSSKRSHDVLKKNLEWVVQAGLETQFQSHLSDIFKFLKANRLQFDVIFMDPPFTEGIASASLEALSQSGCFHSDSTVLMESGPLDQMRESYPPLTLKKARIFQDKTLSLYHVDGTLSSNQE